MQHSNSERIGENMSDQINAGVVLVTKFVRPHSATFAGYINYLDREEAVRNEYSDKWNGYVDYMGNPEKTSELFTAATDCLSKAEKKQLKSLFESAQENDNLMWQTVISFDNRWLEKQGLYNSETNNLDVSKIKELTRNCMRKMLKAELIDDSAIWSAAIHYNTDNIHIHIATIEPNETHRPIREDGEPKGVWRQSTLDMGKSSVVNAILLQQKENTLINTLIRDNIVGKLKEQQMAYDKDLRLAFLKVYNELPNNKRYWNYNNTNLGNQTRSDLDRLSKLYIEKYHSKDYTELMKALQIQQDKYTEAYGAGAKNTNNYAINKEKELYTRLGNTILKEMKEYDKEIHSHPTNNHANTALTNYYLNSGLLTNKMITDNNLQSGLHTIQKCMKKINKAFQKDFQSIKNQIEHAKLEQLIEYKQTEEDISY